MQSLVFRPFSERGNKNRRELGEKEFFERKYGQRYSFLSQVFTSPSIKLNLSLAGQVLCRLVVEIII
jgi:hypothetical protein